MLEAFVAALWEIGLITNGVIAGAQSQYERASQRT
jgi:hypothetical protein